MEKKEVILTVLRGTGNVGFLQFERKFAATFFWIASVPLQLAVEI